MLMMEPIDFETIEQADLFVFGLNESQVNEWKTDYSEKHAYFLTIIEANYGYRKMPDNDDFLYRLLFVMVISFERFYQPLPEVIRDNFLVIMTGYIDELDWKSVVEGK